MPFTRPPLDHAGPLALLAAVLCVAGCTTPPAVQPLLNLADRALRQEATYLAEDFERDRDQLTQTRRALQAAFDRDLAQAGPLTPAWVREATGVYVAAREQLVRHETDLQRNMETRADNLRAGSDAVARALGLLQQRDDAIERSSRPLERRIEAVVPFPALSPETRP